MEDDGSAVVKVEDLAKAIKNRVDSKGLDDGAARSIGEHVLNFFGFSERVLDNVLEPEDRDVFYALEDYGLVVTEREETTLHDGREWRIHYWVLDKEEIFRSREPSTGRRKKKVEDYSLYEDLPDRVWKRNTRNI